mgnify:CR=1 FL=1
MLVEVKNVSKTLKRQCVLDSVSLSVPAGRIIGLQGENGSGKTMLMRVIAGLVKPTEGLVIIEGKTLWKEISFPESLGVLIENPAFLDDRTGLDNLLILARLKSVIRKSEVEQAMIDVGLDPLSRKKYRKYSLGMKQRLGIAAALVESPRLVLLDEPTNALDPSGVEMAKDLIRATRAKGSGIVMTCHDREILEELSDEVYVMSAGRIVNHWFCDEEKAND